MSKQMLMVMESVMSNQLKKILIVMITTMTMKGWIRMKIKVDEMMEI
jgi:hypothetical protein